MTSPRPLTVKTISVVLILTQTRGGVCESFWWPNYSDDNLPCVADTDHPIPAGPGVVVYAILIIPLGYHPEVPGRPLSRTSCARNIKKHIAN